MLLITKQAMATGIGPIQYPRQFSRTRDDRHRAQPADGSELSWRLAALYSHGKSGPSLRRRQTRYFPGFRRGGVCNGPYVLGRWRRDILRSDAAG